MKRPDPDRIAGVILAGGLSRRMGGVDKALAPLGGRPMIAHVLDRLAAQVDTLAINANGDKSRFEQLATPVFADVVSGYAGPLAGIHAAMSWAGTNGGVSDVVTAAADTPFFPDDLVARLRQSRTGPDTIAIARSQSGLHPVFALWPVHRAGDLEAWLKRTDTLRVTDWLRENDVAECEFPLREDGTDPFFNVNTPDDLAEAETIRQRTAA
ncbi:molybdenum cofactor guanylyltransferase MobA [Oricola sp.]|uniref:molybdenum cofactor guanylyltransferase MobA n=1 Tax=Oricola sp. TaxID=1979950 RepID=UPI003518CF16